jgi:hypothetical protein
MTRQSGAAVLLSLVFISGCAAADQSNSFQNMSLLEVMNRVKTCKSNDRGIECNYRIEGIFDLSIAGVGTSSAGIHFMKSDASQPIYASFGLGHGCVIVNRFKGVKGIPEFVFISPKNGVVYESWSDCASAL